ncbi:MAG: CheR family methyltransferase [Desulfomonilaceae bacterium]|nr:CheR family methyltransferase [Desulfomonilaceae bacterium]
MAKELPQRMLEKLSRAVEVHLGLSYPEDRFGDLYRAVSRASPTLGGGDPDTCLEWLLEFPHTADRIEILADHLTVGETYFFRDGKLFGTFEREVLPQLIAKRREQGKRLRIWSAGCASGEEPFSIAIVVSRVLYDLSDWNVTILATDINQRLLRKCRVGVYGQWSFRDVPPEITKVYFESKRIGHEVIPDIRKMVRFRRLNLARDPFPDPSTDTHEMDVIFCRNVLMYFSEKRQKEVLKRLGRCLAGDGWLVVSPAEAPLVDHTRFEQVHVPGVVLFKKRSPQAPDARSLPVEAWESADWRTQFLSSEQFEFPQEFFAVSIPEETLVYPGTENQGPENGSDVSANPCAVGIDLFRKSRYGDAIVALQQALEGSPVPMIEHAGAMATLAKAYANLGMLEPAHEWCEKAVAAEKLNPEHHFLQATIWEEMGDLEQARIALTRALFLDPDLVTAHFAMGNLARRQGRASDADRHYRIALELLATYDEADTLPGSDSLTVGRLIEAIQAIMVGETAYGQS